MAKGKQETALYRVAKFEIKPSSQQVTVFEAVSMNLKRVWNNALSQRQENFESHIAPHYKELSEASKSKDSERVAEIKARLKKAFSNHSITLFDQINALTPCRADDQVFADTPRNWQEEALDTLNGSFVSFMKLRQNGDPDARPPHEKNENTFMEISGRHGFKITNGLFKLSCKKIASDVDLEFKIPNYQLSQIKNGTVKKFTLYCDSRGRFWVSLAYQLALPKTKELNNANIVYLALGASSIGVVSKNDQDVIPIGRADWHWMSKIISVKERIGHKSSINPSGGGSNIHALTPGSRAWKKRSAAKRRMYSLMSQQQTHDRRNIVAQDLIEKEIKGKMFGHGIHFVVTEIVVRSKKGKLADASVSERGGSHGHNFAAQNTAAMSFLTLWLKEKVKEVGGSVQVLKLPPEKIPSDSGIGHANKIAMAVALKLHHQSLAA